LKIFRILISVLLLAAATYVAAQAVAQHFSRVELLFAGDLMQHQSQLDAARQPDGTYSYSPCYRHIREYVSKAEVAIANLETVIAGKPYGGYPSFCAPDSFLHAAIDAGFDIMLLANNHCLDRGKRGILRTLDKLDSLNIAHCGVYRDSIEREQRYPYIIKSRNMRIALLNYTYGTNGIPVPPPIVVNLIDKETIAHDIEKARSMRPDAIVACMHWGDEFTHTPSKEQKRLTDWLLAQGVDHVVGNHPHVLQPMEVRRDSLTPARHAVIYSLSNLVSGMYARGRDGGALVTLNMQKFCGTTRLLQMKYLLTWVARPGRDGVKNFEIWPAATPPQELQPVTKTKLDEFLDDSRRLLKSDDYCIKEDTLRAATQCTAAAN
jgi:poly-gamma-glutamate synthesis protein (capsule biosynthesis protein)